MSTIAISKEALRVRLQGAGRQPGVPRLPMPDDAVEAKAGKCTQNESTGSHQGGLVV